MSDFLSWWQMLPYEMDPVAFHIGWFPVHYYGLSYVVSFLLTYRLVMFRTINEPRYFIFREHLQEIMTFMLIGVFLGGRIGYAILYNFNYYIRRPLEIILPIDTSTGFVFTGFTGMSYHGALIGSILAAVIFSRLNGTDFFELTDLFIPAIPFGYTFGRLANFINGELYGRPTSLPIGMYFPTDDMNVLRHPSQLYEAFFEGLVIFAILWLLKDRIVRHGFMLWIYLILYGGIRFIIEYLRQPDLHIGFVFLSLSMGQILCALMVFVGFSIIVYFSR